MVGLVFYAIKIDKNPITSLLFGGLFFHHPQNKLPNASPSLGHAEFLAGIGAGFAYHRGRDTQNISYLFYRERHHGEYAYLELAVTQGRLDVLDSLNHIGIDLFLD